MMSSELRTSQRSEIRIRSTLSLVLKHFVKLNVMSSYRSLASIALTSNNKSRLFPFFPLIILQDLFNSQSVKVFIMEKFNLPA